MDIHNAATVLNQVADNFTTGYDGKMLDPHVVFLPSIAKLNPALDCVWQTAITSPMYQSTPDWVPSLLPSYGQCTMAQNAYRLIVTEELEEYKDIRQAICIKRLPPAYSPVLNARAM